MSFEDLGETGCKLSRISTKRLFRVSLDDGKSCYAYARNNSLPREIQDAA